MEENRKCRKCGLEKPLICFRATKTSRDGRAITCKVCTNKQSRNLRHAKQKAGNALVKEAKQKGLHRDSFDSVESYDIYLNELRRRGVEEFNKNKPKKNVRMSPQWKRAVSLRSSLRLLIRNLNPPKSIIDIVGKNHEELKLYLENLFLSGMNWDNYGKHGWHVDHIKPCASFDLTNELEVRECFNFSNLQPLWAKDNWKKGFKY